MYPILPMGKKININKQFILLFLLLLLFNIFTSVEASFNCFKASWSAVNSYFNIFYY